MGLEKLGHSGFQAEASPLGCLATFTYLEEILTAGTLEVFHSSLVRTGQTQDRYDQCSISLGPGECWVLFCDPDLATGQTRCHSLGSVFMMSGLELKGKQRFLIPSNSQLSSVSKPEG